MGSRYSFVKAYSSYLGKIWRRYDTLYYNPNGNFSLNKESEIEFNFKEFSKSKTIAWEFHVLLEKKLPCDVVIGLNLTIKLQMDVLYSEYVVVWDGIRLPMQKIQNLKWTDLNLMDQEDPAATKE